MYEGCLLAWRLDPAYINNNWSDELFVEMIKAGARRMAREKKAQEEAQKLAKANKGGTTRTHDSMESFAKSTGAM
ncbi:hypothetical protein LCGC14_2413310 [marine sediment metagenome]|uniref:Uncharacterized protein n=1 Tax=marine sediment metagenome TaxID=412755 RepID=A0A0F9EL75_9ZZZZ